MSRPRITITQGPVDHVLEGLALAGLIAGFLIPLLAYDSLPETIPSHVNAKGEIDDYSNKASIWILPIISLFLYILLTIINKFPHTFNYMVKITPENAARQYGLAIRLNRAMKALCCVAFAVFTWQFIQLSYSGSDHMGMTTVTLFILGIFAVIFYYWRESQRGKRS